MTQLHQRHNISGSIFMKRRISLIWARVEMNENAVGVARQP
ncbi:MAG: hypothetical protein ABI024_02465 [Vicinamibacterales bacterium]